MAGCWGTDGWLWVGTERMVVRAARAWLAVAPIGVEQRHDLLHVNQLAEAHNPQQRPHVPCKGAGGQVHEHSVGSLWWSMADVSHAMEDTSCGE